MLAVLVWAHAAPWADRGARAQAGGASGRPQRLLVDFAAVGEDGSPVTDLRAAEVEIRLASHARSLRSLRLVTGPALQARAAGPVRLPRPFGTNDSVTAGRALVLVIDEESLTSGRERLLRSAVDGLLAALSPADRTMVVSLPFGGVRVPFTDDRERVRRAMAGLTTRGTRGETGSELACRTRRFVETLDAFLQGQSGRLAPLTVAVFTAGLAAPRRDAPMALPPGMCELPITHFQQLAAAASAARANFYLLQPADIAMTAAGWREGIAGTNHLGSDNPLEGIEHLAGVTGAQRLPLDLTGSQALLRVATESAAYYLADLAPERDDIVGRSRPLDVRISRPGVVVRARPEITFTPRAGDPPSPRAAVEALLAVPEPATELALRVAGFVVREASGQLRVGVAIEPGEPGVRLVSVGAALIDPSGRTMARWHAPDASARPMLGAMAAGPGAYTVRAAAIDADGREGVAEDEVVARLVAVGPLALGSLVLGASRGQGVVPLLEFGDEPAGIASFDIYGGAAGTPLSASLEISRSIDGAAMLTLPLTFARAGEARVSATCAIPVGALEPGDYVVRGVVTLPDGTTGRVVRVLRKQPGRRGPSMPEGERLRHAPRRPSRLPLDSAAHAGR